MHGLLSRSRSRQPTPEQPNPSNATPRASSTARSGADRTATPNPHPTTRRDRRQTPPEGDGGPTSQIGAPPPKGPEGRRDGRCTAGPLTESDRRRPDSPPTSHESARRSRTRHGVPRCVMHAFSSATRSIQPTATQHDPSDATRRPSPTARSEGDRTATPNPTRQSDTTAGRLLPRVTGADVQDRCPAPEGARRPTRRKMNRGPATESDRRRPRSPPTSHGSARGSRRRRPITADHPPPRRSAPLFRAHPPAHGHRATPHPDPTPRHDRRQTPPEGEAGRHLRSVARPRRGPKADKTEDEPRTPHRIRPPPFQATADFPRQRARKPKAPTPHRPPPAVASAIPPCVFRAHPSASASFHESSRAAQHRNLMRRVAGRCRSESRLEVGVPPAGF